MKTIGFVLLLAAAAKGDLVVNGGFESGNFIGWTQFGDLTFTNVVSNTPQSGAFAGQFGPVTPGGIEQHLSVSAGTQVLVDFWYQAQGFNNYFLAEFDGHTLASFVNDGAHTTWTRFSFPVTVSGANPVLRFTFSNPPSYDYLDSVSVNVVPAPGLTILLGVPVLAMRRRGR